MPYIAPSSRKNLDPAIDALADAIVTESRTSDHEAAFAGLLNYSMTRLATKVIRLRFESLRYWTIAIVSGVFKNAGDEFYRRAAAPYEDAQIAKNGDVDEYLLLKK